MGAPAASVKSGAARGTAPGRRARPAAPGRRPRPAASGRRPRTAAPARGRTPAGRSSRRAKAASARRSRITPPGGMAMLPVHAVGGAAGAVGGMADSGVVMGMTRGRVWIGVLGILLGGIVALNVWGLSLSASSSGTAKKIDELETANTVLSARIAKRTSSDRVQALAAGLGLESPTPKAVNYVKARNGDAAAAAERLAGGEISVLTALPIAPALADASLAGAEAAAADPSEPVAPVLPTDPAEPADPAAIPAPVEPAPATPDPAATAPPAPAAADPSASPPTTDAGGGVAP